ncbi:hypothetical protein FOZ63_017851, partial [Perkinsus olseni]
MTVNEALAVAIRLWGMPRGRVTGRFIIATERASSLVNLVLPPSHSVPERMSCLPRILLISGFVTIRIESTGGYEIFCRDGLVGVLSTTECFLEENNAVTRAFTCEVTSNGDGTSRTSTQDCKVQRTGQEIQFPPGCPLDHLARRRRPSSYNKTGNGARVLERENTIGRFA